MPAIVSVNNLKDYQVLSPGGETLGAIEDILVEPGLSQIRCFVLACSSGALERGKLLFAVPATAVKLDTENECLVIDVEPRQLQDAPGARHSAAGTDARVDTIYRLEAGELPSRVPS